MLSIAQIVFFLIFCFLHTFDLTFQRNLKELCYLRKKYAREIIIQEFFFQLGAFAVFYFLFAFVWIFDCYVAQFKYVGDQENIISSHEQKI